MNAEKDDLETFSAFTKFVTPLISDHPEPCFDDLLACWMSKEIQRQYSKWKSNEGRIKSSELQITHLMAIWQSHKGRNANIEGFVKLIEHKNDAKFILDEITKAFRLNMECQDNQYPSLATQALPNIGTHLENETPYISLSVPDPHKSKSNSWHADRKSSHPISRSHSIGSNFLEHISKVFRGKHRDSYEDNLPDLSHRRHAIPNDYVKDPTLTTVIKTDSEDNYTRIPSRMKPYTILLMGDDSVGKSTFLDKLGANLDNSQSSAGYFDEYWASISIGDETIVVTYLDLKVDKTFLDKKYVRQIFRRSVEIADGVILFYDITSKNTFSSVKKWIKDVKSSHRKPALCILGNKLDVIQNDPKKRNVCTRQLIKLSDANSATHSEISASTGVNLYRVIATFGGILISREIMCFSAGTQCNMKSECNRCALL